MTTAASSSLSIHLSSSMSERQLCLASPNEKRIHICQSLGELLGLTVPPTEQACFEAAWEMCKGRNWTLLRRCQEELNQIVNEQGRSLLQKAIRIGEIALATEMIANGIAIHVRDAEGNTAMHYAVQTESLDLISKLYEHIPQDAQNFHGQTPLHFAASRGQLDVIRTLIANGANLSASTQVPIHDLNANATLSIGDLTLPNLTPLAFAAIRGDRDCVDLFLSENKKNPALNLNLRFGTMGNLIHLLITFHHMHLLKFLLQKHNEQIFLLLDERNSRGVTPFMLAAYLGEEEALVLLRDKVNLEATDFIGRTAVHHAVLGKQKKSLAYLHCFGVNLMTLDANYKIPLNMLDGCDDSDSLSVFGYLSNLCKHKAKTEHAPPNFMADPPENLVFKGNDPTGFAYLGVIKSLEKNGGISGIRRVAGTSTGTFLAMLFAIGCSFEEMVSKARLLPSFLDSPIADQTISEIPKSAPQMVTLQKLLEITQKDSPLGKDQFKTLHQLPSLCSGKALLDWIEERIYEKTGIHDCTFGELSRLASINPQFKHLTVFTTRFGDTLTLARFSSEDPVSDDIVISHAVCAALSIPGIFPLKILYTKNKAGGVDESPSMGNYGDAATINNFPIETYDFEKFQSVRSLGEEAGGYFRLNKRTLGFALEPAGRHHSFFEIVTVQELLEKVLELYCQMESSTQSTNLYNRFRVVQVRNSTVLDRDREIGVPLMLPEMKMQLMIQIGEEATMEFFGEQKRSASSINLFLQVPERTNRGMKWTNLKSPLPYFVGRTKQIQTLREKLIFDMSPTAASSSGASSSSSSHASSSSSQKRSCIVLAGAGGMGKSETAIAFAHQYRDSFSVVWWIETATPESMDRSLRQLAEALDIFIDLTSSADTTRRRIYHFLQTENLGKPYLLIFDNAEESIELPQGGNGGILITTTQPGHFLREEILPIEPLFPEEAKNLVGEILMQEPNEEMGQLAAELDYLPAILSQAAHYIKTTPGMTLHRYLDLLSKEKVKVLSMMPVDARYSKAQLSTWRMVHETLMRDHPMAYEWLEICAYLQPDAIPSSCLESWLECFNGEQSYVDRTIRKDQILRTLVNNGILRYNEKADSFSLHRIRQEMIKEFLVQSEATVTQSIPSSSSSSSSLIPEPYYSPPKQKAVALMAAIVNRLDLETFDDGTALVAYEVQLCTILDAVHYIGEESLEMASISHLLGRGFFLQGIYWEAWMRLTNALEIRRRFLSDDHPDLARTLNYLGDALKFLGKNEEAQACFREAYKMRKRLFQGDHIEVAVSLMNMFILHNCLTELENNQRYLNRSIEMLRRLYPNGHRLVAMALSTKAEFFQEAGRLDEAYGFAIEALQILERIGCDAAKNSITMADALAIVGLVRMRQGVKDEAYSYLERAIEIFQNINLNHPKIRFYIKEILFPELTQGAFFENYLAAGKALLDLHWDLGKHTLIHHVKALEDRTKMLLRLSLSEDFNNLIAIVLGCIGITQQYSGSHQEAVSNFRVAVDLLKRVGKENTRIIFNILLWMGDSLKALGRNQEAHDCFAQSTAIERIVSGQSAPLPLANDGQMPDQNPEEMDEQLPHLPPQPNATSCMIF
jgi:ankyrin repeat protein/tetratricopeptide (TPR) repeat protein/predicted acylesterase/phospholipase RssA